MSEADKLRSLLRELYVSSVLWQDRLPDEEQERLLDTVLAAAEGRPFDLLGLPFPRAGGAFEETVRKVAQAPHAPSAPPDKQR